MHLTMGVLASGLPGSYCTNPHLQGKEAAAPGKPGEAWGHIAVHLRQAFGGRHEHRK